MLDDPPYGKYIIFIKYAFPPVALPFVLSRLSCNIFFWHSSVALRTTRPDSTALIVPDTVPCACAVLGQQRLLTNGAG